MDHRITEAKTLVENRTKALLTPAKTLAAANTTLIEDWNAAVTTPLPSAYQEAETLLTELTDLIEGDATPKPAQLSDYLARLDTAVDSHDGIVATVDGLIADEGEADRRRLLIEADGMAQSLIEDAQVYQILERKIAALNRQRGIVERLHRHALEARKEAAQEILDSVSSVANTLYEKIHPGENIASLNLAVRTAVERSINLSTRFYGTDEHPLLHYSESHLDTLGLCVNGGENMYRRGGVKLHQGLRR